jgi:DMSO reductase family type II enzyme heme b subunit
MGCAACHGAQGRANGMSAAGLVDDWGNMLRPANLTQGWNYRGGHRPRDILTRLMAGIDGAGMPSYAEAVSSEDAWQLAYYVASLQEPAHWNLVARAARLSGALPETVHDPRWATVQRTDLHLRNVVDGNGEWVQPPTVVSVGLQAMYNGDTVAFRLTWDDPSHDPQAPSDALALVLKPEGVRGDTVSLQAWPYAGAPMLDIVHWTAEDQRATYETVAADFHQIPPGRKPAPVSSVAAYQDGRWQLVVARAARPTHPEGAAAIAPDDFVSVAVAVWDGGNPGARAVSPWVDMAFGDRP